MNMDETDSVTEDLLEGWNTIIQYKDGLVSAEEFKQSLDAVLPASRKSGIPLLAVDTIIEILNNLSAEGDESDLKLKVLHILIPKEPLTDDLTNNLLQWFESEYRNNSTAAGNFIYWLITSLKVGIVNKNYLKTVHYYSLFHLLLDNPHENALSFCLKELTQSHHVTELSLKMLSECYNRCSQKRIYLTVLLKKYAQIMPTVAEKLKIKKFVKPPSLKLQDNILSNSLQSLLTLHVLNINFDETLSIQVNEESHFETSHFNMTPVYNNDNRTKISSLNNVEDVIKFYDSIEIPCNIVSILGSKCGQYYISLSSIHLKNQLEEQVSLILKGLLNNKLRTDIDYNLLLKALSETQDVCNHGMPSVSKFLRGYLIGWDGYSYKDGIISLIPWFYFVSLKELDTFMKNLFNVYVTMTLESKLTVVDAFADLYLNVWISSVNRKNGLTSFVGAHPHWIDNLAAIMESLTGYFETFIYSGFVMHGSDPALLTQALILYYKIFCIEEKMEFSVFTLLPQMVVLLSQTSSSITVLNLLCKILTLYLRNKDEYLLSSCDLNVLNLIRSYCSDTVRILLHGVEGDKLDCLLLGHLFTESEGNKFISNFIDVKNLMSVPKHFATSHIINELASKLKINSTKMKSAETYVDLLKLVAPDCATLVKETEKNV